MLSMFPVCGLYDYWFPRIIVFCFIFFLQNTQWRESPFLSPKWGSRSIHESMITGRWGTDWSRTQKLHSRMQRLGCTQLLIGKESNSSEWGFSIRKLHVGMIHMISLPLWPIKPSVVLTLIGWPLLTGFLQTFLTFSKLVVVFTLIFFLKFLTFSLFNFLTFFFFHSSRGTKSKQ